MNLKDKTAVVTGGARGIGKALCRAFSDHGARVVVADLLAADAADTAAAISGLAVTCDVSREEDIQQLVYAEASQNTQPRPATRPGRPVGIFT